MQSQVITLHGEEWNLGDLAHEIAWCLSQKWHKEIWKPSPALIHNKGGTSSQYRGQKFDPEKITLVADGWNHDHCAICWHTLFETDTEEDGTGYRNEFNAWLCTECFEKIVCPALENRQPPPPAATPDL